MSAVIEFPANRIARAARDDNDAPADVIIFPGVRIERPDLRSRGGKRLRTPMRPAKPRLRDLER